MLFRITCRALFAVCGLAFLAGCTEKAENSRVVTPTPPATTAVFKDIESFLRVPSQVQFTFRLTTADNHAILLPPEALPQPFRIFENGEEIDYSETSRFVHNAASLELDLMLLLDFTNSMATWYDGDNSAIDLELDWAQEIIAGLAETHRMAIMEYHDRNVEASVIADFSSDKSTLQTLLAQFAARRIDHGSSSIWDAVYTAISRFPMVDSSNKQRTLVVLTDGRETSSFHTPDQIAALAQASQTNLFIIGTGNVANEDRLELLAGQSNGEYYPARDFQEFRARLEQVKSDLGGHYSLSYISLRRSGIYTIRVQFAHDGLSGAFERDLDVGSVFGDDRIGSLTFDEPIRSEDQISWLMRAQHVPRNIYKFRFKLDTPYLVMATLIAGNEGGLCGDWRLNGRDSLGYFTIAADAPLQFGDFGPIVRLTLDGVYVDSLEAGFILDNSIYTGGKSFVAPDKLVYAK